MLLEKPHKRHTGPRDFLINRLALSADQQKEFEKISSKHHNIMMSLDETIIGLKKDMFEVISEKEEINTSISNKIGMYEGKRQEEIFSFLIEVRKICSEKQLEIFDNTFKEIILLPPPPRGHQPPPPPRPRESH